MAAFFQTNLAENFQFGHNLKICGKAETNAAWFDLSLTAGKLNDSTNSTDIGLYMLVSINENLITFKQCLNNQQIEVKSIELATHIFLTQFRINIIMEADCFQIVINDNDSHNISTKNIVTLPCLNTLQINGDLEYIKQVDHRQFFPDQWPPRQVYEERVNFSNEQPMSFKAGHVMVITAQLSGDHNGRFLIHLRNAWNVDRQELHVSVRFDTKKFVRNSKIPQKDGEEVAFGSEEICRDFPFKDFHKPFKLAIALTDSKFKIAKDGKFICNYSYRTPNVLKDIVGVKIIGINGVHVKVSRIDHIQLNDKKCLSFEKYTKEQIS